MNSVDTSWNNPHSWVILKNYWVDSVVSTKKEDFLRILDMNWLSVWNFVNELRKSWSINLNIECHGITYPINAVIQNQWIDLIEMKLLLNATSHVPKILIKAPHRANFWITDSTVFGKARLDRDDNIIFQFEKIENWNIYKVRQSRRIILTSKERFLNENSIDWHHLDTYNIELEWNHWVVHDLSAWWVGVFMNTWEDFFDSMMQTSWDVIAYQLDFIYWNERIWTKIKVVNMRPLEDSWAIRLWWQFIDMSPKTEDKIYWLILDAERKALKKIKAQE